MMNINCGGREETCILFDEQNGIDRMSSLPDDICKYILSFLSTREAVQTCILSKKWINTWASVSDLKFDINEFIDDDMEELELVENSEDMAVELVTKFELLVKSVLEKREISCVNTFQLWLDLGVFWPCTQVVPDCICDAMKLKPREFSVKLRSWENLNLNTDLIFTCASLIHLQLHLCSLHDRFVAMEPNSINLPCLKTLNLYGVIMSDDSLKKLLLGCHVLEELVLERFYIEGIIKICSNTLKMLVLCNDYDAMRLQISTPNLMFLVISMDTCEIMLLKMPELVCAFINIPGWCDQDIYLTMGPKLIHNLSNVKSLHLQLHCPKGKVQKKDFSNCPVFNNLKHLKLFMTPVFYIIEKSWGFYVFDLVPFFLHQSPELQELTLHGNRVVTEFVEEEATQEGPRDALVQREFLKTVIIVGCNNDNGFVDQLINKLLVHVKIIGEIIVDNLGDL
ncbi:F-box/LRR-repeat protein At4g14103-like [Carex rostrata]